MRLCPRERVAFTFAIAVSFFAAACGGGFSPAGKTSVSGTANPLVALYTVQPNQAATVFVEFGPDRHYGLTTWKQQTPADGSLLKILVAGMHANTTYHMRAHLQFADGTTTVDDDHTFKTGTFNPAILPTITATASQGETPQGGIELVDATASPVPNYLQAYATDLQGNIIWGYDYPERNPNAIIQPIKLLPNGHFMVEISGISQMLTNPSPINVIREIDLAGNTIREVTLDQINSELHAAGYTFTLVDIHHDVAVLPNGHWIVIGQIVVPYTDLPGYPGVTQVMGDVLVDLDQDFNVAWVWNEFDHLDVNRHPMLFPDWTHTNAVLYSPDDGNLLVSIRHQNWIVKVDYRDGVGTGNILWRLGYQGDFTLQDGNAPQDWQYAQHGPAFQSDNTAGDFLLSMFDNGDDRVFPAGVTCDAPGQPPCLYSTVPMFEINETTKTATLRFHQVLPPEDYSLWGGNTTRLPNGDIEFDAAAIANGNHGLVQELTNQPHPQLVWEMDITNQNSYRATWLPSLYPGVQW